MPKACEHNGNSINILRMLRIRGLLAVTVLLIGTARLFAQDSPSIPSTEATSARFNLSKTRIEGKTHEFWDKENIDLFAGVCGARMLDYASTRYMRGEERDEVLLSNRIVDNRPLFVGIELAGTAASIGVSYLFHRTHHHALERWTSIAHIGAAVGGSIHNYALQPLHVVVVQPVQVTK
jgi:hypothetical protein